MKDGTIPMERLDDAVTRILRVKFRAGLFEAGPPSKRPLAGDCKMLASPEQRALARDAVRQSLVLLKNKGGLLPLAANKHVLVAGDGADNIARQSGGWTLTWQGTGLDNADFPGATSVWGGVKAAVKAGGGSAELSPDGRYTKKPDVAVVVFGEKPYAEFQGDLKVHDAAGLDDPAPGDHEEAPGRKDPGGCHPAVGPSAVAEPRAESRQCLRGRVAAGHAKAVASADVLFRKKDGSVNFDFTGKLSYSWPRDATGTPLNVTKEPYDPLFPFGFGLTYAAPVELAALSGGSGHSGRAHVDRFVLRQGPAGAAVVAARLERHRHHAHHHRRRPKPSAAASRSPRWTTRCRKARGASCSPVTARRQYRSPAKAPWTCRARPMAT